MKELKHSGLCKVSGDLHCERLVQQNNLETNQIRVETKYLDSKGIWSGCSCLMLFPASNCIDFHWLKQNTFGKQVSGML